MIKIFRRIRKGLLAEKLRNTMTLGGVALWREIKSKKLGVRLSDLDVKNNLRWVLEEIKNTMEQVKPTPKPSQEAKTK